MKLHKKVFYILTLVLIIISSWSIIKYHNSPPSTLPLVENILNPPENLLRSNTDIVVMAAGDIACSTNNPGIKECHQSKTAELIEKINPDIVLALGDVQYGRGGLEDYQNYFDLSWGKFKDKIYPTVGNHEYETRDALGYFEYFTKINNQHFYSFDIGSWHIVSLDSNCWAVGGCGSGSIQLKWLTSDLEKNQQNCTLAFWHHPRFSSGLHGNYQPVQEFWEVLYRYKADLILNGHDHLYERFLPQNPKGDDDQTQGITQLIAGLGGRNLYPFLNTKDNSAIRYNLGFGVLKLTLKKTSADFEFLTTEDPNFKDIGSVNCH